MPKSPSSSRIEQEVARVRSSRDTDPSADSPSSEEFYQVGDPVWCHGYPGVVQQSQTPGMIDVRLERGAVTVDPSDAREVQHRDVPSVLHLSGRAYELFRGAPRMLELRGPRGGEYVLSQNVHQPELWGLIAGGQLKPRITWYRKNSDGTFTPIR
jgi:hypothetical protein